MNPRWNKATPDAILEGNKAKPNASIWGAGAGSQASSLHFRSKDKNVLDIPSYRSDGMRRPVSDGMLYAPKLSTCFEHKR
jgi:hypothetical protein